MRFIPQTDFSTSKLMCFSKCSRNFHGLYLEVRGSQKQSRMSLHCSFDVLIVNCENRTRSLLGCMFYGTEHSKLALKCFRKETSVGFCIYCCVFWRKALALMRLLSGIQRKETEKFSCLNLFRSAGEGDINLPRLLNCSWKEWRLIPEVFQWWQLKVVISRTA